MRFELAGSLIRPDPLVLKFISNQNLDTLAYIELGYTHFDVICIGGGGGRGGGIDTANTGTTIKNYGGAGGGGGFHRVRGLLSALPDSPAIVIGSGGVAGTDHASNPALTTDGADGGASTFNANTCRASGGKGGKRAQSNSDSSPTFANGGDGGAGNRTIAGGGGAGGIAGTPSPTGPGTLGTKGVDGTLNNNIGKGGGGGAGGVGKYDGTINNPATSGGRGAYNPGDTSVYGPGGDPVGTKPGKASGAKASPLNGLPTVYGQSNGDGNGYDGIVIIRLTSNVTVTPPAPPPPNIFFGQIQRSFAFNKSVVAQGGTTPGGYGMGIYGAGTYPGSGTKYGAVSLPITFQAAVTGIKNNAINGVIAMPLTLQRVTSGNRSNKRTSVAEISLASGGIPTTRTNHSIKVKARTTTGSTGKIRAALYEGSVNRSGDLESSALTNSLALYTLAIPNAAAALITDYSNLSIRIWGNDEAGNALVFEVSELYLELPTSSGPTTHYGATSMATTFGVAVSGSGAKQTSVAEISLASHATPSVRSQHAIRVKARTTTGSTGKIRVALYEGSTNRSGNLEASGSLTNSLVEYTISIPDSAAATITDYSNLSIRVWGYDPAGNALVFEVSELYLRVPTA